MREREANVAVDGKLPTVLGEDAAVFRVLENLLQNAIKFCPMGTTPQIAVRSRRLDTATVEVTIADNGAGITGDAEHLIAPGARGTNTLGVPGHGIGLAAVARLVTRMGGTVRLESPREGGTLVRLTLRRLTPRSIHAEDAIRPSEQFIAKQITPVLDSRRPPGRKDGQRGHHG